MIEKPQITGLILAGGRGTRMGQVNKGLQHFQGRPMALHVLERLMPQVSKVIINANQDIQDYEKFGVDVYPDVIAGFAGPLAGIETGLIQCKTPFLLSVPCDSPFLPMDLAARLLEKLSINNADVAIATTIENRQGEKFLQRHPVFALIRTSSIKDLSVFIAHGGRKVDGWLEQRQTVEVLFPDNSNFANLNTLQDLQRFSS
ncbi:molybdenum cofactor guanylyltransferase MobA [Undibacterium sp. RuRC25W]|uniref:molybdenum cofactor guanylyltransferase MobA n=1 Tax=Undibacterium sp. RuRC25W TaxID=3413047 RepID=UPI003BEFA419